jgi:DNA-directed RNA polymerase subunit beta'
MATLAEYLLNEQLPEKYKVKGEVTKSRLKNAMTRFAKEEPGKYPEAITNIKKIGDQIATYDGISVGLDDIAPQYTERNRLIRGAVNDLRDSKNIKDFRNKLLKIQEKGISLAKQQPGSLGLMVSSGGRGNPAQLMKAVVSPLTVKDNTGQPYPYLIKNSYSEGLTPAEYWIASNEARQEVIRGQLSTATPGDMSKQISSTLNHVQITKPDCGTSNGIPMSVADAQTLDRYLAKDADGFKRNTLITPEVLRGLKKKKYTEVVVRSPLTCLENPGVCQKCYGLNEKGQEHGLGTHVGLRSAQALAEPLTQMVLSSKHGVSLSKGEDDIGSVEGVRQLLEIPRSFKQEAELAKTDGTVKEIITAPQGGNYIYINDMRHYAGPNLDINVKKGQKVYAGDSLTSGMVNPRDLVQHKGLGTGRNYMVNKMYDLYKSDGVDIDKRHLEILAKENLNWAKINEPDDEGNYVPGDIVNYNVLKHKLKSGSKKVKVNNDIMGDYLGDDALYFTAGTRVTPSVYKALKSHKIKEVNVTGKKPDYEPIAKPIEQIPLLSPDWVRRLGHRRLKDTLLEGAAYGHKSPITGSSPYPAMLYNPNFATNLPDPEEVEY